MLKGVNKLIIEINNPESELFERAIFFVRPEKADLLPGELNKNAQQLINDVGIKITPARKSFWKRKKRGP